VTHYSLLESTWASPPPPRRFVTVVAGGMGQDAKKTSFNNKSVCRSANRPKPRFTNQALDQRQSKN